MVASQNQMILGESVSLLFSSVTKWIRERVLIFGNVLPRILFILITIRDIIRDIYIRLARLR
jgi:hypothetical protein